MSAVVFLGLLCGLEFGLLVVGMVVLAGTFGIVAAYCTILFPVSVFIPIVLRDMSHRILVAKVLLGLRCFELRRLFPSLDARHAAA